MSDPQISVVIPVYNEKPRIQPTAEALLSAWGDLAPHIEILFVDDNSPDGTADEVAKLSQKIPQVRLVQHGKKEGIGAAHHAGYHAAKGAYVMCLDADLSQSPADLLKMKLALDAGSDLVIGSRYMAKGKQLGKSMARDVGSKGMNWMVQVFLGVPLTDSTHTFRAFKRGVHDAVCPRLTQKGHPSFQIEFSYWAVRQGYKAMEIPIIFTERLEGQGQSKISVKRELPPFLKLMARLTLARLKPLPQ